MTHLQTIISTYEEKFEQIGEGRVRFTATRQECREFMRQFAADLVREAFEATKVEEREINYDTYCGCDGECFGDCNRSFNKGVESAAALIKKQ